MKVFCFLVALCQPANAIQTFDEAKIPGPNDASLACDATTALFDRPDLLALHVPPVCASKVVGCCGALRKPTIDQMNQNNVHGLDYSTPGGDDDSGPTGVMRSGCCIQREPGPSICYYQQHGRRNNKCRDEVCCDSLALLIHDKHVCENELHQVNPHTDDSRPVRPADQQKTEDGLNEIPVWAWDKALSPSPTTTAYCCCTGNGEAPPSSMTVSVRASRHRTSGYLALQSFLPLPMVLQEHKG